MLRGGLPRNWTAASGSAVIYRRVRLWQYLYLLVHNRGLYTVSTRRTTSAVNTLDSM